MSTVPESSGFKIHRPPLRALTGVRFLAATYVVIFHTRVAELLDGHGMFWIGNFFHSGYLAVPFFFVLSGFILAYTYVGQIRSNSDTIHFWEARIARIWPTYALSLILTSIPSFVFPAIAPAFATLLMVQAWNPWRPEMAGTWNSMCWTLSIEAFFYLVFPWCQVWLERFNVRSLRLLLVIDLFLGVVFNVSSHGLGAPMYPGVFRYLSLPVIHLPEFLAGVVMGNLFLQGAGSSRAGIWTYAALLFCVLALMLPKGAFTSVVLVGFSALIYFLAKERTLVTRILSTKLLVFGGGISYAMYLLQTPVREWTHSMVSTYSRIPWQLAIVPVILMLLSAAVYLYFEDPARRLLRFAFGKIDTKSAVMLRSRN
jgi:peptidoglycan/LPS O-acetylase OafA/YrhL